jgi:hypothetical protein
MLTDFTSNYINKFKCELCDFMCCKKGDYTRHLLTNKHISNTNLTEKPSKNITCKCVNCDKIYNSRSGLWSHSKKCVKKVNIPDNTEHNNTSMHSIISQITPDIILSIFQQNKELQQLILEQNKTIIEMTKTGQVNNTINQTNSNNNNSNNKTFNLQFFLNETCKDAMNMKDFIKSLELSLPELEKMGEIGFAEGMSRVFVNRLNSLDITKRPIHCSDVKREIIHIKDDNKWEMDNANLDRLRKIIKQLTIKNILKVDDWKKANQGCTEYNSRKNAQYLKINMEAIGPVDEAEVKRDFGKIIRRVAETTAIDKKYLCA